MFGILNNSFSQATELTGTGATFPQPVILAWAYQYYKQTKVKINYQGIGSGGGIRQAQKRIVDFGASGKKITKIPPKMNIAGKNSYFI